MLKEDIYTDYSTEELRVKLNQSRNKFKDVATMGALIASILDLDSVLSVMMEMSLRAVNAEVGLIQLEHDGELVSKVSWGIDDFAIQGIMYKRTDDISSHCFKNESALVGRRDDADFTMSDTIEKSH